MKIDLVARFGKYVLALVIAILSFLGGSVTDVGQAVQIALDKDAALRQATEILNDSTPQEVKAAVEE